MQQSTYWFPAKRYGWGWGLPTSWQGWLVLTAFTVCLGVGAYAFPPPAEPLKFGICVALLVALLTCICWVKGEPPRWRWGK